MKSATTPRRRMPLAIGLLVISGVFLAYRVVPYTAAYRNYKYSRMSADEMLRAQSANINDPLFLYHLGHKLNQRGQYSAADPYLERAAGLDPESAVIRDEWVKSLMGHGRISVAFGIIRQFMATHPHSPEPSLLLGKFYITREDWAAARRALDTAARIAPNNAEIWSLLAHSLIKLGKYGDAQTALSKAIELNPSDANNHLQLAVLIGDSDKSGSRREFMRAAQLAPSDPVCLRQYGRFLLDNGDAKGAEREARAAVARNPQDALAQMLLGRVLMAQSRWQDAATPLQEAARLVPTDPQAAEHLRRLYRQANQPDLAAQWSARYLALTRGEDERRRLMNATQARPKDPKLHHLFAESLARIDDIDGCVREEAFAARSTPDNPRALAAAARDLDRAGRSQEALPLARQAAIQNANPAAQQALGDVLLHLGRLHEAAIHYDQIKDWKVQTLADYKKKITEAKQRINESQAPAEKLLRAALREDNTLSAEATLNRALQIEPENTRCLRALLRLQVSRGEHARALATAMRLLTISPEDGVAHTYYVSAQLALLGDSPLSDSAYADLNRHLQAAAKDASVTPVVYYDRGLVELKRGQAQAAVNDLTVAQHLEPDSIAVYDKLSQGKSLVGDREGARQAKAEFDRRQHDRMLLGRVANNQATVLDFKELIAGYQATNLPKRASELRTEAIRRFGAQF